MKQYQKAISIIAYKESVAKTIAGRENGHYIKLAETEEFIKLGLPPFYFSVRWNHFQTYPQIENQTKWSHDWLSIIPAEQQENETNNHKNNLYQTIIDQGGGCIALGRGRRVLVGNKESEKLLNAGDGFVDIKTATPETIAAVVSSTSSWEPDTKVRKHNSKNKTEESE